MPVITLPADGDNPYGVTLRTAITDINTAVDGVTSAWVAYVPTTTNLTIGNGTLFARYKQIGKTVHVKIRFTLGTTSAVTGNPTFSLPLTAANGTALFGKAYFLGSVFNDGAVIQDSTTVISTRAINASATYATYTPLTSTIPFTWATNHYIDIGITYEAA